MLICRSFRLKRENARVVYDALNAEAELQRVVARVDRQRPRRWPAAIYSTLQSARLSRLKARSAAMRGRRHRRQR